MYQKKGRARKMDGKKIVGDNGFEVQCHQSIELQPGNVGCLRDMENKRDLSERSV